MSFINDNNFNFEFKRQLIKNENHSETKSSLISIENTTPEKKIETKKSDSEKNKNPKRNIIIIAPCCFVLFLVTAGTTTGLTFGLSKI